MQLPNFAGAFVSALAALVLVGWPALAGEADAIRCRPFFDSRTAEPIPRGAASVLRRFEEIKEKARAHAFRVLFLGDSLTHRWDEVAEDHQIWERHFGSIDPLNAGINGDRTEHLLWRIRHGNLDNQQPRAIVLLIGTNDLGHGRSPDETAEGIRQILVSLRNMRPKARILLEGLWPRTDRMRFGPEIESVNQRIKECADQAYIIYAEPGSRLLDRSGRLPPDRAPDGLHPSPAGYEIVTPAIAKVLAPLLTER